MRFLLCSVAAVSLTGCATTPSLTRQEALQATTRTYTGVTQEEVIGAAERVLTLADGDDFTFAHRADGFLANRRWSVYLVLAASIGNDIWIFSTSPRPDGSVFASVEVGTSASAIVPMATTTPSTWTASSLPPSAVPVTGPALYELFWSRVEYLMGFRDTWTTCKTSDERVKAKTTWGDNSALCNAFNMKDLTPDGPLRTARAAPPLAPVSVSPRQAAPVAPPASAPVVPAPQSATAPAVVAPAASAAARPPAVRPVATTGPAGGYVPKFIYQAEHDPEVRACNADVTLAAAGPGFENYTARCANGEALALRCEWGTCRVLK